MEMVQAHQGLIQEDGRFIPDSSLVKIPKNQRVVIFWNEEITKNEPIKQENLTPEQKAVAENFLIAVQKLQKEGFTEEDEEAFARWDSGEFRVRFGERLPNDDLHT